MESKFSVFGCLTCGEYLRSPMIESMVQIEMHMCNDEHLGEKRQKLMKLREIIDEEIGKINVPEIPPPPPMPLIEIPKTPLPSTSAMSKGLNEGSLQEQIGKVVLKKVQTNNAKPKAFLKVQDLQYVQKFGKENAVAMKGMHTSINDEMKEKLKKKRCNDYHPYKRML